MSGYEINDDIFKLLGLLDECSNTTMNHINHGFIFIVLGPCITHDIHYNCIQCNTMVEMRFIIVFLNIL